MMIRLGRANKRKQIGNQQMNNFVTIMTFLNPMELAVLRGRLEADGIECRVLDELTAQVNPFYANAIGGIKLQVRESDVQKAIEILKEGGYIKDEDLQPPKNQAKLDKITSNIPLLKNLRFELRLMIIVAVVVVIVALIIYFITLPSTFERLTKQSWCVDKVVYNGETYMPNTVSQFYLVMEGFCQETIILNSYGTIKFPGFNSQAIYGEWRLEGDFLHVSQVDTFDFVYNGIYDINFLSGNKLILKSEQSTIYCYPQNTYIYSPF